MEEKQKILVADDAKDIREILRIMLEDAGFEVVLANNGIEALEKFDDSIQLVILDIMMPLCDGIDACTKIREQAQVPILFLTAKSAESDMIEGFEAGGDDYLIKPFSCTELLLRVRALLRRAGMGNVQETSTSSQIVIQDIVLDTEFGEKSFRICDVRSIRLVNREGYSLSITAEIQRMLAELRKGKQE